MVYTSMKEVLIGELRDSFVKKYPNIQFDYYSAGAGKIMAKIAAERQSGKLVVDVLWTSEVPDFYSLKQEGVLQRYKSPEAQYIVSPLVDPDYDFTPARLGTLGVALQHQQDQDSAHAVERPLRCGVEGQLRHRQSRPLRHGHGLRRHDGGKPGLGLLHEAARQRRQARAGFRAGRRRHQPRATSRAASASITSRSTRSSSALSLGFVYPKEMLVVPSPVAIFKGTPHLSAAQKFVDFLLSKEGQTIIAGNYTLPVRKDVPIVQGVGLVSPDEAVKRAMKIDYLKLMVEKQATIDKFTAIMQKK